MKSIFHRLILLFLINAAVVSACAPRVDIRGNMLNPDVVANVEIGHITKAEVRKLIGSPSSISPFSSDTWYYFGERTETSAFFKPQAIQRKVLVIEFDTKGVARQLKSYGLKDAKNIQLVKRTTPTAGKEFTILKQLFGNIGRFDDQSQAK